ncbi:hypothetical protein ONZ43_g240 [Nemania bipapillata]|uniref:Uncharacterized protein n=1 Tax=Nemania bipapillata TaxID=110536 RepID=A0ACC2J9B5_9PEZI|nr:hypothetical protein ONZ43_g240 [Nemania bipapillata]
MTQTSAFQPSADKSIELMDANLPERRLKVAVLGAGPAGLGIAIELAKLPFVEWKVSKLQTALLKVVDKTHIHLAKKLVGLEHLPDNRVRILFQDGFVDEVDLLIAADGIRSVVRAFNFPGYTVSYKGQNVYRTTVSKSDAKKIDGIPWAPTFWKHVSGLYVYTCPLGDDDFEVTARFRPPKGGKKPVSWGQPFNLRSLLHEYDDFCLPVRQILGLAAQGETQEFALFSGPRLEHMVSHGNTALIGDASHPLLGNFGSGAGFALEDAYTLAKVLEWAFFKNQSLPDALGLFDRIRSPHYARLYGVLDKFATVKKRLQVEDLTVDEEIAERVKRISLASESWMYYYEIDKVVENALQEAEDATIELID